MPESAVQIPEVVNTVDDPRAASVSYAPPGPTVTGEETAAPAEDKKGEEEEKAAPAAEDKKPENAREDKARPDGAQKRIDKLTFKLREAERQRDEARQKITELEKVQLAEKPKASDFESEAEYTASLAKWETRNEIHTDEKTKAEEKAKEADQAVADETKVLVTDMITRGRDKYKDDFEKVALANSLPVSQFMTEIIAMSDVGEDILYHLGKNPERSLEIARMSPSKAAYELGKLEAQLTHKPQKRTSQAPEPIEPIKSGEVTDPKPENMSMKQYIEKRKKDDSSIRV